MNDEEGNFVIASADEGFVPIPIRLPSDELTLTEVLRQEAMRQEAQVLGQETFP